MSGNFNLIKRRLKPDHYQMVVKSVLDRKQILSIVKKVGITFSGMRIGSIPTAGLIDVLIEECCDSPQDLDFLVKSIDKFAGKHTRNLTDLSVKEFSEKLKNLMANRDFDPVLCGALLWVAASDPRDEIGKLVPKIFKKYKRFIHFVEKDLEKELPNLLAELEEEIGEVEAEDEAKSIYEKRIAETEKEIKVLRASEGRLKDKVEKSSEDIKIQRQREVELKTQLNELIRERDELKEIVKANEKSPERLIANDISKIRSEIKDLSKVVKNIEHDLNKVNSKQRGSNDSLSTPIIEQKFDILQSSLEWWMKSEGAELNKVKEELEQLHQENLLVQNLLQKLPTETKQPTPAKKQKPGDRIGVFVDVQNMYYAAKRLNGARLNYELLLDTIVSRRRLIKAMAYVVLTAEVDQTGFIALLSNKGYQVKRKELKHYQDGKAKGDWDMGMAIDMIEIASDLDVIALVSGDGDFVALVSLLKKIGPKVEIYAFEHNLSTELRENVDLYYLINERLLLK